MLDSCENCYLTLLNVYPVHIVIKYITFTDAACQKVYFRHVF